MRASLLLLLAICAFAVQDSRAFVVQPSFQALHRCALSVPGGGKAVMCAASSAGADTAQTRGGWRSKAATIKVAVAGALAATAIWPVTKVHAAGLNAQQGGTGGLQALSTTGGARQQHQHFDGELRSAGGRAVAFATPRRAVVATAGAHAPQQSLFTPSKVAGGAAAVVGVAAASRVVMRSTKGSGGFDDFDEEEANKPHPLRDAFDECENLKIDELKLSAWKGTILQAPPGSQMEKKQAMAGRLAAVTGWYGKAFGAETDCQALVMKLGPLRFNAPLGLGDATMSHDGYRLRWSTIMRTSVEVRYKKQGEVVDYIRRKDENTLMGVAVRGKDPLVFFELERLKE